MDATEAAAWLGIELMPWQRDIADRMIRGERMFVVRARRGGMTTVRRVVAVARTAEPGFGSTPEGDT